jgi:RNase H-like domain found in reverse transcriptase
MKNYSTIVAPLTSLLRKGKSIKDDWGPACDEAFAKVKHMLTTAPVLQAPDFKKPFEVHTDASIEGLGAALLQDGRPVAFYSRKLNNAERNYTTTEQECLAVLCALREWRCYLEGVSFTLYTDHQPLTFMNTKPGTAHSLTVLSTVS